MCLFGMAFNGFALEKCGNISLGGSGGAQYMNHHEPHGLGRKFNTSRKSVSIFGKTGFP